MGQGKHIGELLLNDISLDLFTEGCAHALLAPRFVAEKHNWSADPVYSCVYTISFSLSLCVSLSLSRARALHLGVLAESR